MSSTCTAMMACRARASHPSARLGLRAALLGSWDACGMTYCLVPTARRDHATRCRGGVGEAPRARRGATAPKWSDVLHRCAARSRDERGNAERKRYKGPFCDLPSTPAAPLVLLSPTESHPHPHDAPSQRHATSRKTAFYRSASATPQPPPARLPTDVGAHLPVRSSLSAPHLVVRRGSRWHPRRLHRWMPDDAKELRRVPRPAHHRSNLQPASAGTC